jgi:hypothetical protein
MQLIGTIAFLKRVGTKEKKDENREINQPAPREKYSIHNWRGLMQLQELLAVAGIRKDDVGVSERLKFQDRQLSLYLFGCLSRCVLQFQPLLTTSKYTTRHNFLQQKSLVFMFSHLFV